MTHLVRPLDNRELSAVQLMLRTGLLEGLDSWKDLYGGYEFVAEQVVGTAAGEVPLEEEVRRMLDLQGAHAQRVQVFIASPAADWGPKLLGFREEIISRIKARDGSLPDENGVVMTVDFATADAFRHPFHLDLKHVVGWLGRLLVQRAVFGTGSALLLEFGRDLGPEEWIAIGAKFRPAGWRVQGRRVLLYCDR
jgi:hypothetical protein